MKKIALAVLDISIFLLAAVGSLMAFGIGAAIAVLKSSFGPKTATQLAMPEMRRTRRALSFIYFHSGVKKLIDSISKPRQ